MEFGSNFRDLDDFKWLWEKNERNESEFEIKVL